MTWICDTCGEQITDPQHGWVEWTRVGMGMNAQIHDMRLVHHATASPKQPDSSCQCNNQEENAKNGGFIEHRPLRDYVGPDGLMSLLGHLADPTFKGIDIPELIKRFHVPGYDLAKGYFNEAVGEHILELNCEPGFYRQDEIQAVLDHYELA
jgi:hypothetical protein